ncbi:FAD-dependent oxidoreductase [Roseimicrobium sp. ORNL1]|uniref:FAD-dependent oxidoreductase n=1 Tax=Roseimicrobium sp. ORNL1 TaxID=2711231 RepID=UPI0013E173B1|nr:FAD-dependent oxidoreductase [Roseimicrobium sp. ORNL1]QIF01528.1 FAD-dependent oxidoreductase [Roseimicrobium sp. ORNL1]
MKRLLLLAAFLLLHVFETRADEPTDIIVYGGTSAGVTSAVQAARMGKRVTIVEPGKHLGGMSASGLGMTDNGSTDTIGGLAREFYQRVYLHYTEPTSWKTGTREEFLNWLPKIWGVDGKRMEEIKSQFLFEPSAAEKVFNDMAREAGVQVVFNERLDLKNGVRRDGPRITSIVMESGREFKATMFIDATYEGDLMAKAGVKYIVGREPNSQYEESLNGAFPFTPAPFPKVSPYVVAGDPKSGLLPRVEAKPPGPKGTGDHRVQAYNFRISLTDVPENRVPLTKPPSYNPLDYELLARHIATMKNVRPGPRKHAAIGLRGNGGDLGINFELVPNRKTDSNCGSEFGSDMYGASYDWPEADYAKRQEIWELHKNYTLGLLWFLATDPRLPQEVRDEMQCWGLPKDEFTDNSHFPFQLYVREARRMISDYVVTEHDAKGARTAEDGVAIGSYPLDSHGVTLYIDEKGVLHRERGFFVGSKSFPISYRAIRPRAEECTNLLVPGCLSSSHAAYGSIRMEPVFMMLGQAAATAASLAIEQKTAIQEVPYAKLRERLLADKQILDRPARTTTSAPDTAAASAPEAELAADLQVLAKKDLITSPDYWLKHAVKGERCEGEKVGPLLLGMARTLGDASTHQEAVALLAQKKVLSSTDFWEANAVPGKSVPGSYMRLVLRGFASRVK